MSNDGVRNLRGLIYMYIITIGFSSLGGKVIKRFKYDLQILEM